MTRPSYAVVLPILLLAASGCGSDTTSPQPVASVSIVSGDDQQVALGQPEPAPLIVAVTAPNGDPMPGVQVNWGIVSGGGTLSATSSMTDQSGHASVNWTLGLSGPQVVKAWTNLDGTEPVNFSAGTFSAVVTMVSGDAQKGPFSLALPAPLVVSVTTPGGTPLPGVKVNWGVAAGGGSLSSASSVTDQNGMPLSRGRSDLLHMSARARVRGRISRAHRRSPFPRPPKSCSSCTTMEIRGRNRC